MEGRTKQNYQASLFVSTRNNSEKVESVNSHLTLQIAYIYQRSAINNLQMANKTPAIIYNRQMVFVVEQPQSPEINWSHSNLSTVSILLVIVVRILEEGEGSLFTIPFSPQNNLQSLLIFSFSLRIKIFLYFLFFIHSLFTSSKTFFL